MWKFSSQKREYRLNRSCFSINYNLKCLTQNIKVSSKKNNIILTSEIITSVNRTEADQVLIQCVFQRIKCEIEYAFNTKTLFDTLNRPLLT